MHALNYYYNFDKFRLEQRFRFSYTGCTKKLNILRYKFKKKYLYFLL